MREKHRALVTPNVSKPSVYLKTDLNKMKKYSSNVSDILKDLNVHVQALLASIPGIGGALSTYFSEIRSRLVFQRIEKLFIDLDQLLNSVKLSQINGKYIQSENFGEYCVQAALQAGRTPSDFKIKKYLRSWPIQFLRPYQKTAWLVILFI